jgi:dihydroxyacetone kinase phosphoprotein-dependent L subunit
LKNQKIKKNFEKIQFVLDEITMKSMNTTQLKDMMLYLCSEMSHSKEIMCEADRHIGDGDHGIGMAKGFEAAQAKLKDQTFDDVYKIFFTIGRTMIKEMGGASGIIFGMLFYAGSKDIEPSPSLNVKDFSIVFEKALSEIKARGQAQPGDKTVVDALQPMVEAMQKNIEKNLSFKEMVKIALDAANQGKEDSKKFQAKYGRAKTLGERAIGYADAGAVSLTLIMQFMLDWLDMQ